MYTELLFFDNSVKVDIKSIESMYEVVDAIPVHTPVRVYDQIKIYVNGATKRLYLYDYKNRAWLYATLT